MEVSLPNSPVNQPVSRSFALTPFALRTTQPNMKSPAQAHIEFHNAADALWCNRHAIPAFVLEAANQAERIAYLSLRGLLGTHEGDTIGVAFGSNLARICEWLIGYLPTTTDPALDVLSFVAAHLQILLCMDIASIGGPKEQLLLQRTTEAIRLRFRWQ